MHIFYFGYCSYTICNIDIIIIIFIYIFIYIII